MNLWLLGPEVVLVVLGLALLLLDGVVPGPRRRLLGHASAGLVAVLFLFEVSGHGGLSEPGYAFDRMFVLDGLAIFFKALFLGAGVFVLLLAADLGDRLGSGVTEYFVLTLFALAGMLLAASANNFAVMYVALELITVSFYVLTGFQRSRIASLEAGVKYLLLGALSSAFMVYGMALCFGASGTMQFDELAAQSAELAETRLFQAGMLLVLGGLSFKVAVFPFQIWAPDVYEGAPAPTTAFLTIGSKAAGVVLLVRLLGGVIPELGLKWEPLLMSVAAISILFGSLCAIPQRSLKRLMGYSSIANGGFVLMGLAAMSKAGAAAVLFYLAGYLFTVLTAFLVVAVVVERLGTDDLSALAGLHRRSPLLAASLAVSMISLAGVPPLAGFFGKFLVLKALVEQGASLPAYYALGGVAVLGVVISFWYYFGVLKAVYWTEEVREAEEPAPLVVPPVLRAALVVGAAGVFLLGIFPGTVWDAAVAAVALLKV
ncbi:MAG: NADH-quinone oxidoreductase subunit N [Limisphaerales bacterium]